MHVDSDPGYAVILKLWRIAALGLLSSAITSEATGRMDEASPKVEEVCVRAATSPKF